MKKNNSEIYRLKKNFSPIINNKNLTTIRNENILSKKYQKNNININYYIKDKRYVNSRKINKKKSFFKKDIISNLKKNINELINNNHLNNKNKKKPKTPSKIKSYRLKSKKDFIYNNKNEENTNKIRNIEINNNCSTKIDNSISKSSLSLTRFHRNRSAQNIKKSELNLFKTNFRIYNNSNNSNNIFKNHYLKNIIQKYPIKNDSKEKYENLYMIEKEKYINNKNKLSKDKNTQVTLIENDSKNVKKDNYILSVNTNDLLSKTINMCFTKKFPLIKDNKNIEKLNSNVKNNLTILNTKKDLSKKIRINYVIPDMRENYKNIGIKDENKVIDITEKQKQIKIFDKININPDRKDSKEKIKAYDVITQAGINKNQYKKINQDYYIISTNINKIKNYNIFGVLDGHGLYGHLISIFVGRYILNNFIHNEKLKSCSNSEELYYQLKKNNFQIINEIFINAEKELYKAEFDSNFSGTTCIIVIEVGNHLICANTGDSRAILIYTDEEEIDNYIQKCNDNKKKEENESKENNIINSHYQIKNIIKPFSNIRRNSTFSSLEKKIKGKNTLKHNNNSLNLLTKIFCLSYDLKPTLPLEKKRINKSGGRVEQFKEKDGNMNGPPRVWVKNEMFPGLAMSRSIGDFIATSVGVIPDPEIIEYTLNKNSRYLIIATDGIWEFISNEKVMKIGNKFYPKSDPINLCNELVKEANLCWEKENFIRDDITVLVVYF